MSRRRNDRQRLALWKLCRVPAGSLVGQALAGVPLYHFPEARLGLRRLVPGAYFVGHALVLTWALRTVRMGGWLPRPAYVRKRTEISARGG